MSRESVDDGSKRVKNIAAVLYLLAMIFLVGGSYLHQQSESSQAAVNVKSEP